MRVLVATVLVAGLAGCQSPPDPPIISLQDAVTRGNVQQVRAVLYWCHKTGDCDANGRAHDGRTALHVAARMGWRDVTEALLDDGADVNARDGDGQTSLHTAVTAGNAFIAALLIDAGSDINTVDRLSSSPLEEAMMSRRPEDCTGHSPSFIEGCRIYAEEQ